jgi:flagellin-like protein
MMDKRGISPLIATILLILMSVGMGVAVMSWGEEDIEEKAEFVQGVQETTTTCDVVSMNVIKVGGVDQMCLLDGKVKGMIDNGPDVNVEAIHARILGENGASVVENVLDAPLPKGSAAQFMFPAGNVGAITQIKFTPSISMGGKKVSCPQKALLVENVKNC